MPFYFDETATSTDETETRSQPREEPTDAEQPRDEAPRLVLIGGRFVLAAPEKEEPEQLAWERALEMAIEEARAALVDPRRKKKKGGMDMLLSMMMIGQGVDLNAVKMDLPFNAQQVPAAGKSVLVTIAKVKEAEVMKPRVEGLKEDLEEWDRLCVLGQSFGYANEVIEANKSCVLNRISAKTEGAVKRVDSLLEGNIALRRGLKAALALRQDPVEQAKKTKSGRKRVAADAAADAEATAQPENATPEVTQTTVTTTQPKSPPVKPPTPRSKPAPRSRKK